MSTTSLAQQPLFFLPNRVWRCYTGGALLDRFLGHSQEADGHLPEDWLASCVRAINGEQAQGPDEGLSRLRLPGNPTLLSVLATDPTGYLGPSGTADGVAVLCKYLDSAVRLPIQCHPDRAFARQYLHSEHGKAESWLVLDCRTIAGEEPYLLMGFRPGVTAEAFADAVARQDIPAMEGMLNRIPVQPGDVYYIPGRFPHAIGPGVFMLEVQEPTDWVVQPEAYCADTRLSAVQMWGPLDPATALLCFEYTGSTADDVRVRLGKQPRVRHTTDGGQLAQLIGPETTECFGVDMLTVNGHYPLAHAAPYYLAVVVRGQGSIAWQGGEAEIRRGDAFLVPHGVRELTYRAEGDGLTVYLCIPGASA